MTDALEFIHSEVTASSDESELESEDSFATRSYEEEDLYSSESEMATAAHSKVVLEEKLGPSLSNLSLDLEGGLREGEQPGTPQCTKQEIIRQIHLRQHIDGLRKKLNGKETKVEECRLQLVHCRDHLNTLLSRQCVLQTQVAGPSGDKTASLGLLRSQLAKVTVEVDSERNVELNIQNELRRGELELCEAQAAMGRFEESEARLAEGEKVAKEVKMRQAVKRLQAENKLVVKTERARKAQERLVSETQRDQEAQTRALVEGAREAQERGRQFLHASIGRRRKEEAAKEEKERVRLDKRVKALLSLKKNIDSSQGTLHAQQMLRSESARKKAASEEIERERILSEGGNPDEAFLRKQRIESFEQSKEAFLKKQNEKQVEIINKLLEEEKTAKKSASKSHSHGRKLSSSKKTRKTKQFPSTTHEEAPVIIDTEDKLISVSGNDDDSRQVPSSQDGVSECGDGEALLVEPEIRGLWDKGQSSVGVVKRERSKMEVAMMQETLEKLKMSKITKQVVAGREFKGQAFISKPAEVIFKDFDVDKTYHKKVTLTNVSYSFNYCKLVGVTHHLMDFLSVEFNPPGSMSAGLTCTMVVTFKPKLNDDMHGGIEMLSQTGPFTIPVACLTKKCLISADRLVVDFGRVCVGETVRRKVTLTNSGSLPTNFKFESKPQLLQPSSNAPTESVGEEQVPLTDSVGEEQVPPTDSVGGEGEEVPPTNSVGGEGEHVLTRGVGGEEASTGPLSDKSVHSIMSNVEPRPSRMDSLTIGGLEEKMTRSVGDLSCVSHKSLSWGSRGAPVNQEGNDGEDTPTNSHQDDGENKEVAALCVGGVSEGEVAGFSTVSLELVYSPTTPSQESAEFIVTFSHPLVPPMVLTGVGCGGELPVWLEREAMDLRVCVLDRLYQDTILIHNRASTALRVTFQVPSPLQPHLEVLPKHGVVQGESSYSAQLKFTPKASIMEWEELTKEEGGGTLVMPVEVHVVDQTQPLLFMVSAIVTPSELSFDPDSIDFGSCTTHECVVATLHLTNTSLLPQSFGFLALPAFVDVQPGDGLGEILPQETLAVDVVFSARKPRDYSFELTIKTALDKTYKIPCRGVGILPALELSHNAINFSATALGDSATTSVRVSNPRQGRLSSAVIRGALLPQGPKMFEFSVPPECPITVSPQVGEVPLGESVSVSVVFSPHLDPGTVREEAVRLVQEELLRATEKAARLERERIEMERQQQSAKKKGKKSADTKLAQRSGLLSPSKNSLPSSQSKDPLGSIPPEPPEEGSDLWRQVEQTLLRQFTDLCLQVSIPCFVSSEISTTSLNTPPHRVEDTLYLEVTAPMVRPALVLDTDYGNTSINYDSVGTGDCKTKMIAIKNLSDHVLKLRGSVLDPHGPFELRNALRELSPGQSRNLIVRFSPLRRGKFCEHLVLTYNDSSHLRLKLSGTGVQPDVSLTPDTNSFDLGHAMVRDTVSGLLQLTNHCPLAVRYQLSLESSLPGAAERRKKKGMPFRASNYSGAPPFVCPQTEGLIEGDGGCSEVTILFSPDHQSSAYRDTAYIDINGQRTFTIQLRAKAWTNNMYACLPNEPLSSNELNSEESMAASPPLPGKKHRPTPLVLLFTHHLSSVESGDSLRISSANDGGLKKSGTRGKPTTITSDVSDFKVDREISVGCIKSSLVKKTSGDFSIDALPSSHPHSKYFTVSPLKMSVEAGSIKTVLITFSPPIDHSLSTLQATTNLTLKGDTSQVYKLLLRGLICE